MAFRVVVRGDSSAPCPLQPEECSTAAYFCPPQSDCSRGSEVVALRGAKSASFPAVLGMIPIRRRRSRFQLACAGETVILVNESFDTTLLWVTPSKGRLKRNSTGEREPTWASKNAHATKRLTRKSTRPANRGTRKKTRPKSRSRTTSTEKRPPK